VPCQLPQQIFFASNKHLGYAEAIQVKSIVWPAVNTCSQSKAQNIALNNIKSEGDEKMLGRNALRDYFLTLLIGGMMLGFSVQ
jgi:hypothetical protein